MISGRFHSAAGEVVIDILNVPSTHEVEIFAVAPITYKYDLTPDNVNIDQLLALYQGSAIDIDRWDTVGVDMYDLLRAHAPGQVRFTITTWEREVFEFTFKYELGDLSDDEESEQIAIRLKASFNDTLTSGEVFDEVAPQIQFTRNAAISQFGSNPQLLLQPYTATGVGDWIREAMKQLFGDYPAHVRPGLSGLATPYAPELFGSAPATGQRGFVMVDFPDLQFGSTQEGRKLRAGTGTITTSIETTDFQNGIDVYIIKLTGVGTLFDSEVAVGDEIEAGLYLGQVITRDSDTVMYTMVAQNLYLERTARPFQIISMPRPRQIPALDVLKNLAGVEGSFFGSGFSRNFYINRLRRDVEDRVYIPWSSVRKPKPIYQNNFLGESFVATIVDGRERGTELFGTWPAPVSTTNRRLPNLLPARSVVSGNRNASKSLNIAIAAGYPFMSKGSNTGEQIIGDYSGSDEDELLENALTQVGIQAHFKALTGAGDQFVIQFDFEGAFAVKPWQTFVFTDAPPRYANKEFRLTEISHDIVNDIFAAKSYQIDTVAPITVPERIANLGLDFQFGNKILPPGFIAPINNYLANGLRHLATFITAEPLSGTIQQIPIIRAEGDQTVIPATYKLRLVNPALVTQEIELEVDVTLEADQTVLTVFPTNYAGTFPAGSFIYVSNRSIMTGILTGEFGINMFSRSFGVGVLTGAVNGQVTELPVDLWSSVPQGRSLFLIDILSNTSVNIQTTGAVGSGPGTMAIEEQLITMPAGALIYHDGAHLQALFSMDPGHIQQKVIREEKANAIGEIATGHAAGIVNQLDCIITRSNSLQQGQLLRVSNQDGTGETFVVPEDFEIIAYETIGIPVVEKTTTVDLLGGATVQVPAANINSRITVTASQVSIISQYLSDNSAAIESIASIETRVSASEAQVVMKALVTGGNITKLALVALSASAGSGSAVNILADQVNTTGQANFFSSLYAGGVASETFADSIATTRRDQARNNVAAQLGYTNYSAMVDEALLGRTIINGAYLRTSLIDVDAIFAVSASVTALLTLGSGGRFTNASDDFRISSAGIQVRAGIAGNVTSKQFAIFGFHNDNPDFKIGYLEGLVNGAGTLGQVSLFGQTSLLIGTNYNHQALFVGNMVISPEGGAVDVVYVSDSVRLYAKALRFNGNNAAIDGTTFYDYSYMPRRAMDYRYVSAIPTTTPQAFSNHIQLVTSGLIEWKVNGPRIYNGTYYAQILYTSGGSANRNAIIPMLTGNRTLALIDQAQTFTANHIFSGNVAFSGGSISVPDSENAAHALQVGRADLRYGRLHSNNDWTGTNEFGTTVTFNGSQFNIPYLPNSNPGIPGRLWVDAINETQGYIKISIA